MWTAKKCGYGDHRCNKKAKCIQNHDRVQRSKNKKVQSEIALIKHVSDR